VTTDRREALKGAKYVIATFQVGGVEGFEYDYKIPLKHGVDQCIGDTLGPGGVFRALRSIPVMMTWPKTWRSSARTPSCSTTSTRWRWSAGRSARPPRSTSWAVPRRADHDGPDLGLRGLPKDEIDFLCAGINHMGWFLKLEHEGRDLYPELRERFEQPEYYVNEKVRGEVFRHFGYFMTESTGHLAEYVPWFPQEPEGARPLLRRAGLRRRERRLLQLVHYVAKYAGTELLADEPRTLPPLDRVRLLRHRGAGDRADLQAQRQRDQRRHDHQPARRLLRRRADLRRPLGLHKTIVGDLPPQCAALNLTNINVQRLAVEAGPHRRPGAHRPRLRPGPAHGRGADAQGDPRDGGGDAGGEKQWLPQFEGKTIRPTPTISIPKDVKPAPAPIDPALAIFARFGELAEYIFGFGNMEYNMPHRPACIEGYIAQFIIAELIKCG
jgi:alpha-galactosidase